MDRSGTLIAVAFTDGKIRVWNVTSGQEILGQYSSQIDAALLEFSPDGTLLAVGTRAGSVKVCELTRGQLSFEWKLGETNASSAPKDEPSSFGRPKPPTGLRVLSVGVGRQTLTNDLTPQFLRFSPDGKRILCIANSGKMYVWDVVSGRELPDLSRRLTSLIDGALVVSAFNREGQISSPAEGWPEVIEFFGLTREKKAPIAGSGTINALAAKCSSDGRRLVTYSAPGELQLWDVAGRSPIGRPLEHGRSISAFEFSADGLLLLTTSDDGTLRIWDAIDGALLVKQQFHWNAVKSADFDPTGRRVVVLTGDGFLHIFDARSGRPTGEPVSVGNPVILTRMLGRSEKLLTVVSNGGVIGDPYIRVWNVPQSEHSGGILWESNRISTASFSADGEHLYTIAAKAWPVLRDWDIHSKTNSIRTFVYKFISNSETLSFNMPNSRSKIPPLGAQTLGQNSYSRNAIFPGFTGVSATDLSGDGRKLALCLKAVEVWDVNEGRRLVSLPRQPDLVTDVRFSADGQHILISCADQSASLWSIDSNPTRAFTLQHETGHTLVCWTLNRYTKQSRCVNFAHGPSDSNSVA